MKKVLAIMGSPRKCETDRAVQLFQQNFKKYGEVEFETVYLKDLHIENCKGCMICYDQGEWSCPLKDDVHGVFNKLLEADGVVFATPVYSLQVTALMKTLLDRLSYVFHRPCFFHKSFIAIVTQGVYGNREVLKYLESLADFWGFNVVRGIGLTTPPGSRAPAEQEKICMIIEKGCRNFYKSLTGDRVPSPTLKKLIIFRMVRSMKPYMKDGFKRDYEYFKENGWMESDYYYEIKLNPFNKIIGALVDKQGIRMGKRMQQQKK